MWPGVAPETERLDELRVDGGVRSVRGTVRKVVVTGGATVAVQGIVSGPVTIDGEARLCVEGLFSGTVDRNDGLLVLAGQANLDVGRGLGRVGLAVGSTIVCTDRDGEVWTVSDDGTLGPLEKRTTHTEVDAGRLHWFDTPLDGGRG